jgi:kynureninase
MTDPLLRFRDRFPILGRSTYMVSNSLGAMPDTVPAKLAEYAESWATHGVRAWARGWWEMPLTVGDLVAPLMGAAPHEVAMAPTVTLAQAAILTAMDFTKGRDTVVMTDLDFPSVRYAFEQLAPKLGARIVVVPSEASPSTRRRCMRRSTSAPRSSASRTSPSARRSSSTPMRSVRMRMRWGRWSRSTRTTRWA